MSQLSQPLTLYRMLSDHCFILLDICLKSCHLQLLTLGGEKQLSGGHSDFKFQPSNFNRFFF